MPVFNIGFLFSRSRDEFRQERIQAITEDENKVYRCRAIKNCTATCPKGLNPASAILKMKAKKLLSDPVQRPESV